jgi:ribosomal protein S18 acetylase RimI-like enzyme
MIAQAALPNRSDNGVRPFDMRRDLLQLADLIELTFRAELDATGNTIAQEMKRLATSPPLLWIYDSFNPAQPLLSGYVYVDGGRLVGNVSLNVESEQRGLWSISNVAVHPDYRTRGIARHLMEDSLQKARSSGAQLIVLEVRTDNLPAQKLYRDLGFQIYDTVDELSLPAGQWPQRTSQSALPFRQRRAADWPGLYELCKAAVPAGAQMIKPVAPHTYRLGIEQRLRSWFDWLAGGRRIRDWILEDSGQIIAWLQATLRFAPGRHLLQVTVHPQHRGDVEQQLLGVGLDSLKRYVDWSVASTISTCHPEARQAWHQAGFCTVRLLDRMMLDVRKGRLSTH